MAKIKSSKKHAGAKEKRRSRKIGAKSDHHDSDFTAGQTQFASPEQLYSDASEKFFQLQVDEALPIALKALGRFQDVYPDDPLASCPALLLLGEIHLGRAEVELSRSCYLKATELDPQGRKAGATPFLWCAQLSEEGGDDSIRWFEQACTILRRDLNELEEIAQTKDVEEEIQTARNQLGEALCSMTEVYMTDLSFDSNAGSKCDALITEAALVCPESPTVLQTVASVRISEVRIDEARSALTRSMQVWKHLPADDVHVPDFATRISLTRLLLEVEMESEAIDVVDQLVQDDDESVEALYLGAWSRSLLHEKSQSEDTASESRDWFRRCLRLYTSLGYEDEKLRQHAVEVIARLDEILGTSTTGEEEEDEADDDGEKEDQKDDDWEDEDEEIGIEDDQDEDDNMDVSGGATS